MCLYAFGVKLDVFFETLGGAQMLGGSCIIAACLLNLVDADRL